MPTPTPLNLRHACIAMICLVGAGACGGLEYSTITTLRAPGGAAPEAAASMAQGNRAFAGGRWDDARAHYERVVAMQPTVAEAHYNLALTLDQLGRRDDADAHYTRAADLAPGHPVIWNSRKYRRYGDVTIRRPGSSSPALPGLGGIGGNLPGSF